MRCERPLGREIHQNFKQRGSLATWGQWYEVLKLPLLAQKLAGGIDLVHQIAVEMYVVIFHTKVAKAIFVPLHD